MDQCGWPSAGLTSPETYHMPPSEERLAYQTRSTDSYIHALPDHPIYPEVGWFAVDAHSPKHQFHERHDSFVDQPVPFQAHSYHGYNCMNHTSNTSYFPCPSPSNSGMSTTPFHSDWSDNGLLINDPGNEMVDAYDRTDISIPSFSGDSYSTPSCVALNQIQTEPDDHGDHCSPQDHHLMYDNHPHEGFHPMAEVEHSAGDVSLTTIKVESPSFVQVRLTPENTPRPRSQRPARQIRSAKRTPDHTKRIPTTKYRHSHRKRQLSDASRVSGRSFPCPLSTYGCTSTFGSKNEWKRHINTQHVQLGIWRCDQCPDPIRRPNIFNRKDLFVQHIRRMHPTIPQQPRASETKNGGSAAASRKTVKQIDEAAEFEAADRCRVSRIKPPTNIGCLYCSQMFKGPPAWDDFLEHLMKHLEVSKRGAAEAPVLEAGHGDTSLEAFLVRARVVKKDEDGELVLDQEQ